MVELLKYFIYFKLHKIFKLVLGANCIFLLNNIQISQVGIKQPAALDNL